VPLPVQRAFFVWIDFTQFSRTNALPFFPARFFRRPEHPGLSQSCQIAVETPHLFENALLDPQLVHSIHIKAPLRVVEMGQEEIVWCPRE
jgi:hypothetical protein